MFILMLVAIGNNVAGTSAEMAWDLTSIIASGLCAVFYTSVQIFWYYSVNTWFICGHLTLLAVRFSLLLLRGLRDDPNLLEILVFPAMISVLALKAIHNFSESALKSRIMLVSKQPLLHSLGLFLEYDLIQQQSGTMGTVQQEISPSLMFKFSLIGELLKKNKHYDNKKQTIKSELSTPRHKKKASNTATVQPDPLLLLHEIIVSSRALTPEILYVQLILQIIFIEKNLLKFSTNLANYKKSVEESSWGMLTYYLLEALIRGRLSTLSSSGSDTSGLRMNVFSEIFRELSGNSSLAPDSSSPGPPARASSKKKQDSSLGKKLDLEQAFSCKYEYLRLVSGVNQLMAVRGSIFSQLVEKHGLKSLLVYKRNKLARQLGIQLDTNFSKLAAVDSAPNFMLATSICYFLKVRHDAEKAEKIFRAYQARLSKLLHISNNLTLDITEDNFQYSSVILKVNLSNDQSLGMITDITPNYREHLGEPEEGDPTRVNINSLFPGSMSATHTKMMRMTQDQNIFNRQREFQINGFDGHLRPLSFVLKLDSSVSGGLHALALLRFPEDGRSHLAIVSDKLFLTTAENDFWQAVGKLSIDQTTGEHLMEDFNSELDLMEVCPTLAIQIKFFEFLRTEAPQSDSLINNRLQLGLSGAGEGEAKNAPESDQDFRSSVTDAEEYSYNRLKKRVFDTAAGFENIGVSHLYITQSNHLNRSMKLSSGVTKVQKAAFGDQTYYRIWVTFDLNFNKEARKVKGNQMVVGLGNNRNAPNDDKKAPALRGQLAKDTSAEDLPDPDSAPNINSEHDLALSDQFNTEISGSFEHLLKRLKVASPIVSLVNEALGKNYPAEIKAALHWIQEFYKASEAAGPSSQSAKLEHVKSLYTSLLKNGGGTSTNRLSTLGFMMQETRVSQRNDTLQNNEQTHRLYQVSNSSLTEVPKSSNFLQEAEGSPLQVPMEKSPLAKAFSAYLPQEKVAKLDVQESPLHRGPTINIVDLSKAQEDNQRGSVGKKGANILHQKLHRMEQSLRTTRMMTKKKPDVGLTTSGKKDLQGFRVDSDSVGQPQLKSTRSQLQAIERNASDEKGLLQKSFVPLNVLTAMAQAQAFTSQNAANLQLINQQLSDFKGVKRAEFSPDGEKNNSVSVSTKTSSSKGSHLLKIVRSTQETSKSASVVYVLGTGLIFFSVLLIVLLQINFSSLLSYNSSNTSNYVLVSQFLFLDRKVIQGAEIQTLLFAHINLIFNKSLYDYVVTSYAQVLPPKMNSTTYLFGRLDEAQNSLLNTMESITHAVSYDMGSNDVPQANKAVFRDSPMVYADRYIDLSSIYKPWVVTYFNSIYYYVDLIRENLNTAKSLNNLALSSNFVFQLTSRDEEQFSVFENSRLGRDRTVFGSTLRDMEPLFAKVADDIIANAVDRHFVTVYMILYLSLGLVGCMLAYNIYIAHQINEIQKGLLSNYSLLRPWELLVQNEESVRLKEVFTKFTFNEMHLISEYFDFGLISQQVAFNRKINNLQEKFSKEKDKISGGYKFHHNFYYFSSKWSFFSWVIAAIIFIIMWVSIANFLSINDQRIGAEMLIFQSHRLLLGVTKNYLSLLLMTIHGYNLQIAGADVQDDAFANAIDDFLVFQTGKRRTFIDYFGTQRAATVDEIAFGNICGLLRVAKSTVDVANDFEPICRQINQGSASKGMIGFLQFQKQKIDSMKASLRQTYPDFFRNSLTRRPTDPLIKELFGPDFLQLRIANWMLYNVYYSLMNEVVTSVAQEIKKQLDTFIGKIMQYISLGLYLVLVVSYYYLFRSQAEELDICYETFKLIDPYFLMSNRYLQHKFKSAFKGVE